MPSWPLLLLLLPAFFGGAVVGYLMRPPVQKRLLAWRTASRRRKQLPKLKGADGKSIVPIHRRRGA